VTIGCDLNFGALVQRFDGVIDDVLLYDPRADTGRDRRARRDVITG